MRKYLIGILIGFSLACVAPAYASEVSNLIGRTIEGVFSVQIDGKKIEKEALVVDGTTYLPVRAFGEAIGYEVSFDENLGVSMKKKVDPDKAAETKRLQDEAKRLQEEVKANQENFKLQLVKESLENNRKRLALLTESLNSYPADNPEYKAGRDETLAAIEKTKAEIERLEKELAELENQ